MSSIGGNLGRWVRVGLVGLVCGLSAGPIQAQAPPTGTPTSTPSAPTPNVADLEKRIRELEAIVRVLQADRLAKPAPVMPPISQLPPAPTPTIQVMPTAETTAIVPVAQSGPAPSASEGEAASTPGGKESDSKRPVLAGWDEKRGFFLRSTDDRFDLRLTGQLQADYRAFLDERDYTDVDTFLVRRARLGIEATVFKYYEFRLLPDFSNNQSPGVSASTRIQDAYINVHYVDCFQIETGKFKQPFSYEQLIQDRFVPTLERSMFDQLVPARDEGVMIHGRKLLDDRLDYAISVSNGEINGDFDTNKVKDVAGRIAVRPFNSDECWPLLRGLQLGVAGTTGVEQEPVNPLTLRTPATVPWFQFNSTVRADGLRNRWSPEVVYFYHSLGFAAQYFREEQRLRPTFSGAGSQFLLDVPFDGYYFLVTYLLTGEERTTYSEAVKPLRPFDPFHPFVCSGAWELVARVSGLSVGDDVFTPLPTGKKTFVTLADPTRFTNNATELTVGFNWYLNPFVRMQFNWEHAWFEQDVRLGPGAAGLLRHQDSLLTRFQVIF